MSIARFSINATRSPVKATGLNVVIELNSKTDVSPVAAGIANALRSAIVSRADGRWNKSGHLLNDLRVVRNDDYSASIVPPSDRLESARSRARFIAENVTPALLDDVLVESALNEFLSRMFTMVSDDR